MEVRDYNKSLWPMIDELSTYYMIINKIKSNLQKFD